MSVFEDKIKNLSQIEEDFAIIKEKYVKELKEKFIEIMDSFFQEVPQVPAIAWVQYTPYFNDGDPCVFRVGEVYCLTALPEENCDHGYDFWEENSLSLRGTYEYQYGSITNNMERLQNDDGLDRKDRRYYNLTDKQRSEQIEYYKEELIILEEEQKSGLFEIHNKANLLVEFISRNDELLLEMYGDHCIVVQGRHDSYVTEYEHE